MFHHPMLTSCLWYLDAPIRLKKELDSVLLLQADLDASEHALQTAHTTIEQDGTTRDVLNILDSMEHTVVTTVFLRKLKHYMLH